MAGGGAPSRWLPRRSSAWSSGTEAAPVWCSQRGHYVSDVPSLAHPDYRCLWMMLDIASPVDDGQVQARGFPFRQPLQGRIVLTDTPATMDNVRPCPVRARSGPLTKDEMPRFADLVDSALKNVGVVRAGHGVGDFELSHETFDHSVPFIFCRVYIWQAAGYPDPVAGDVPSELHSRYWASGAPTGPTALTPAWLGIWFVQAVHSHVIVASHMLHTSGRTFSPIPSAKQGASIALSMGRRLISLPARGRRSRESFVQRSHFAFISYDVKILITARTEFARCVEAYANLERDNMLLVLRSLNDKGLAIDDAHKLAKRWQPRPILCPYSDWTLAADPFSEFNPSGTGGAYWEDWTGSPEDNALDLLIHPENIVELSLHEVAPLPPSQPLDRKRHSKVQPQPIQADAQLKARRRAQRTERDAERELSDHHIVQVPKAGEVHPIHEDVKKNRLRDVGVTLRDPVPISDRAETLMELPLIQLHAPEL